MDYIKDFINYIDNSPVNFYAISNAEDRLIKAGYKRVFEDDLSNVKLGDKIYFKRMDLSLIAFDIGLQANNYKYPLHIIASHVDSPCFKIKPNIESRDSNYIHVDVEPYGGMIVSSWLDRLLSIAGRVTYKKDDEVISKLINIDEDILMMPNLCIHFNRDINDGYKYNYVMDSQPISNISIKEKIFDILNIKESELLSHDLYLYNRDKCHIWGEYISSPRLDDLQCVYTSLMSFIESHNDHAINVLYLANNEEVGSSSSTGADSDYLYSLIKLLSVQLGFSLESSVYNSYLISADNAHAIHPNHMEVYDKDNAPKMNEGLVIKYNASNRYTSDSVSAGILIDILSRKNLPYQSFANKSDIRGGSTLGNILLNHVSMLSVDVGLAQLAMHSSFETAGAKDIELAIDSFKAFYSSDIIKDIDKYIVR